MGYGIIIPINGLKSWMPMPLIPSEEFLTRNWLSGDTIAGNSEDPYKLFQDFMGRKPSTDALLKDSILA